MTAFPNAPPGELLLGRLGRPEEVTAAVRFLASDEACYVIDVAQQRRRIFDRCRASRPWSDRGE